MNPIDIWILNFFLIITIILLTIVNVSSFSIDVLPGSIDCFIVKAAVGVSITGSFEIIHPDADFISVQVTCPKGDIHFEKLPPSNDNGGDKDDGAEGFFTFDAETAGDYKMCFANGNEEKNDGVPRLIAFNFRAVSDGEQDYQFVGLKSELADLKEGLELLKDHQSYMNQREDVHKDILESINTKVLCWTALEAIILLAMAFWQIYYIRSFFEIKRRL